jgi:hypothetical protein
VAYISVAIHHHGHTLDLKTWAKEHLDRKIPDGSIKNTNTEQLQLPKEQIMTVNI